MNEHSKQEERPHDCPRSFNELGEALEIDLDARLRISMIASGCICAYSTVARLARTTH